MLVKYPKTPHLTWSESVSRDDKVIESTNWFSGKRVIVSLKLDGENSTLYSSGMHARSLNYTPHESRDWLRNFHATIKKDIPDGWRVCGENVYAMHSIQYDNLKSYFYGFSVWDDTNVCLDWDSTIEWFSCLGIQPVPVLYDGIYIEGKVKALWDANMQKNEEGYVVRLAEGFHYKDFSRSVAKFVRRNHVATDKHWMYSKVVKNKLLNS